jgi:hypothetical protein
MSRRQFDDYDPNEWEEEHNVSAASEMPSVTDMMMRKERKAGTAHVHRLTDYIAF